MSTGFTYGQKLGEKGWETADEIVRFAERDFNARGIVDFDVDVEIIGDETTAVDGDSRLYEIKGVDREYSNTVGVSMVGDEGLKLDSYSPCDEVFHGYGESLGRVISTSPVD